MSSWPASLPKIRLPVEHTRQDGTLRTDMEAGPQKVRRRFSAVAQDYRFSLRMTGTQYDTLLDFFEDTLGGGSLRFDMDDPRTGSSEEFRFTASPGGQVVVGNSDPDKRIWDINIELERLP